MNLFCIKCSKRTNSNDIQIKCKIDGKINLYSQYTDRRSKMFETTAEEELRDLLKFKLYIKQFCCII